MGKPKKKLQTPRAAQEIQREYTSLCAALGQTTYQIERLSQQVKTIRSQIEALEPEAAARNKLDTDAKNAPQQAAPVPAPEQVPQ